MGNKPARIRLPLIDQVDAWAHYDNGEWHIEQTKYTLPGSTQSVTDDIKRNKKVDVPTEQWQKNVEREADTLKEKWDSTEGKINRLFCSSTLTTERLDRLEKLIEKLEKYMYNADE